MFRGSGFGFRLRGLDKTSMNVGLKGIPYKGLDFRRLGFRGLGFRV